MENFAKLTRNTGETIYVNVPLIAAIGAITRDGELLTYIRLGGAVDVVRETPEEVFAQVERSAA